MVDSPPLYDPDFWAGDPYPAFAALRAEDPVHLVDGPAGRFWAVTRHADVLAISKDPATFCSGNGVLLTDLTRPVLSTDSIIYLDPPKHSKHRKLVSPSLSVRRVAELEDRIRAMVIELLDEMPIDTPINVVDALAAPLPLMVIAELVGVPRSDLDDFRRWSDAVIQAATEFTDEVVALSAELFGYIDAIVQDRHKLAKDDLVSVLAHGMVDGEAVSDVDINMFVLSLLVAGNETTRTLISNGLLALHAHPEQRALMASDGAAIPDGVEELLRWEAPIMSFCRTATQDTELSGTAITEGDYVVMLYQSANRDEAAFGPTADQLDVTRSPNPHTSFGYAEHYCLGAGLARLEARIVFEELLARWPDYEVAGDAVRQPSRLVRGITDLPLVLQP